VTRAARILIGLAVASPLVILVAGFAAYQYVALDPPARLSDGARAAVMRPLRAAVDATGAPARPTQPELERTLPGGGPAIVSFWSDGKRVVRVEGHGARIADAVLDAATQLAGQETIRRLDASERAQARLQVDLVVARAPMVTRFAATRALGLTAGVEGLGVTVEGRTVVLAADELVDKKLLGAATPIPMVEDFKVGLEFDKADGELAVRAALPAGHYGASARDYWRFRADSFVERPLETRATGAPLPLFRGLPPGPELSPERLHEAALAGGKYLSEHLAVNGRYYYEVDLVTGKASDPFGGAGGYSLPRHAGTTYFLAQLYAATRDPALRATVERALDHMVKLIEAGGCSGTTPAGKPYQCVVDKGDKQANLGSAALAVVAIAEYRLATSDPRYDQVQLALVEWILSLQKPDGRFAHLYDVARREPDWKQVLLYFDGEAALALARSYKIFKDPRMLRATERVLDALVAWYDFFAGQFFFGEEHWTCIASEAVWPDLKHDRYREFCSDYAAFLRTEQFQPGQTPGQEDLAGAYSVTPFFVPSNTPVGSRSEAMISAYLLTKYHGRPDERIRAQVLQSMTYLLRQQLRADNDWATPARAPWGGMPSSAILRSVRIDMVQHTCSAMLRAIPLLQPDGPGAGK